MSTKVAAIVVSHNSEPTLERCLHDIFSQEHNVNTVILVDSGSVDQSHLMLLEKKYPIQLLLEENVGFSKANNLGYKKIPSDTDFVLFVNPDLFLSSEFVTKALAVCENDRTVGIVSGKLLGYDLAEDKPNGKLDSTGIQRKWYGRWYDRGQGEPYSEKYEKQEVMPALCGALLFCRTKALQFETGQVFDPDFFLYKEDIELSLRVRESGWKLLYDPDIIAFHCRGWSNERENMPYKLRKIAAESEVLLYKKHPSPFMLWALLKYFLVTVFRF